MLIGVLEWLLFKLQLWIPSPKMLPKEKKQEIMGQIEPTVVLLFLGGLCCLIISQTLVDIYSQVCCYCFFCSFCVIENIFESLSFINYKIYSSIIWEYVKFFSFVLCYVSFYILCHRVCVFFPFCVRKNKGHSDDYSYTLPLHCNTAS